MANQPVFLSPTFLFTALLAGIFALSQAQAADGVPAQTAAPDLQQLQQESRQNASELATLKETVKAQSLLVEELKRNSGSDANSSEISSLKQEISNLRSSVGRLDSQMSSLSSKVK